MPVWLVQTVTSVLKALIFVLYIFKFVNSLKACTILKYQKVRRKQPRPQKLKSQIKFNISKYEIEAASESFALLFIFQL